MSIDPYTGQLSWNPPANYAGKTVQVTVRVRDSVDRAPLKVQEESFKISVNSRSPAQSYVGDIYGALVNRLPTAEESAKWTEAPSLGHNPTEFRHGRRTQHGEALHPCHGDLPRRPWTAADGNGIVQCRSEIADRRELGSAHSCTARERRFIRVHSTLADYVNAVNRILTFGLSSASSTKLEISWLGHGVPRTKLVNWISQSQASTTARVNQLFTWYFGAPPTSNVTSYWSKKLATGAVNTDSSRSNCSRRASTPAARHSTCTQRSSASDPFRRPVQPPQSPVVHPERFGRQQNRSLRPGIPALPRAELGPSREEPLQRTVGHEPAHPEAIPRPPAPQRPGIASGGVLRDFAQGEPE